MSDPYTRAAKALRHFREAMQRVLDEDVAIEGTLLVRNVQEGDLIMYMGAWRKITSVTELSRYTTNPRIFILTFGRTDAARFPEHTRLMVRRPTTEQVDP